MTEAEKQLLSTFEARVRHLIFLHDELKNENARLKKLLEEKKNDILKKEAEYEKLQEAYTNLKAADIINMKNGGDLKETKLRLSKLVREVDKCIALLNE